MDWKYELWNLLIANFGDQTIDEGIEELVSVTSSDPKYHEFCMMIIEKGIDDAKHGGFDATNILRDSWASDPINNEETVAYLEHLQSRYLVRYLSTTGTSQL